MQPEHREQMELVVQSADVGVWYCPLPFDELIWDAKVKEHFHLPPDAPVTIETFYERLHPDDREPTRIAIDSAIREHRNYDIDYRTVSVDGRSTKWIRAVGRAFYGADGEPIRFDGVTSDISHRKRTELALRASEERYRLAMRATNDVVWDWDLDTNEVSWNESLFERFGHLAAGAGNATFWLEHIHPDDHAAVSHSIHEVIEDPSCDLWKGDYRFLRVDGTYAHVFDRGWVLRDASGRGIRMIGAMQDRSEQRRIEVEREKAMEAERFARSEAERQSRMKDEFLTTLSHELRTPLNAILGWSQMILFDGTPLEPRLAKAFEVIARNAQAQARIVDDLLDMRSMLSGKLSLSLGRVSLEQLLDAAMDAARPTADTKGVRLVRVPSAVEARDAQVVGDANRLQQVYWNLLSNALKFTPAGSEVRVSLVVEDPEVVLRVSDDGAGITAEFLPHVFDRFRQADGSTTRRHGGLGLGLAIVKQVVELHGGTVTAASAGLGHGATFEVRLPLASRESNAGISIAKHALHPEVDLRGRRVLVVEDDPDAQELMARVLRERGTEVTTAGTAEEALTRLQTSPPFHLLVSDIGLPDVNGYELLHEIRVLGHDLPAIAVTAYARPEDRIRAVAAGFLTHVSKPIDAPDLLAVIAAALARES